MIDRGAAISVQLDIITVRLDNVGGRITADFQNMNIWLMYVLVNLGLGEKSIHITDTDASNRLFLDNLFYQSKYFQDEGNMTKSTGMGLINLLGRLSDGHNRPSSCSYTISLCRRTHLPL